MKRSALAKLFIALIAGWLLTAGAAFAQQGAYPQLDISGFKKWEYKKASISPSSNYFSGLTQLGGFYPTFTGGPWQERLQLRILGKLSENLSVAYDLEQQPETPDRYDVKVKYDNTELTFGDFNTRFSGNEFASASKYLNGVMITAKDSWYDITTVPSAKLKSQTKNLTAQNGNNTKGPYSLGHGSIVESSERIELNGNNLTRNSDYTIDYFEGKITFSRILSSLDEFKYSYEYTNILDLFFPSLSKRDFFGFQSRFTIDPEEFGRPMPKEEPLAIPARDVFPSPTTEESEISEEEAAGYYHLKKAPVVRFSEQLHFMGTELKKNEDYIIRYTQGEIKLLTRFLPSTEEPLTVEYKFYQTSAESELIAGIDSRGPYHFSHQHIVPEGERIEVDGKIFVRDLDYSINYDTGEIVFGILIGSTSQIKATYRYNTMVIPTPPPSRFPKELKIGTTYLREAAKAGGVATTATAIESFTGSTIIDDNYHVYLQTRPVVSTGETYYVVLTVDGRTLTNEVDYVFPSTYLSNGYYDSTPEATLAYINDHSDPSDGFETGTIKIINTDIVASTSEVIMTYVYYKSIVGRYSGVGDGTLGPYYLRNIRNIVPGTETIQVWEQGSSSITTYTRNSSYEGNAGDTGYSINYNADNPSITFNKELETTKNFQIIYQYVPPSGTTTDQDISQSVLGVDGSFRIGDILKVETAYAKSEIDRYIVREPTTESFTGSGTKSYTLSSPQDIIENSEKIYVNDQMLNKDLDYYFSYTKPGQMTFYYITPTTQDAIRVEYDYQSIDSGIAEITTRPGAAYRLGAETKLFGDALTFSGATKKIDYDFTPMGGTSIGIGSEYEEYGIKLKPDYHSFYTNYSYKQNYNPIGSYQNYFLKSYDNSITTGINPGNLVKIDLTYRNYKTKDDLLPTSTAHNSDNLQNSYSVNVTPASWTRGILTLNQNYALRRTSSQTDLERDSNNYSETNIDYIHTNGSLKFTERFSAGYDYQISEPKTVGLRSSSTEATAEAISSHTRSFDTAYSFQADLTPGFLQKWTARVSLSNHTGQTMVKSYSATDESLVTKNETYHTDFIPFNILRTALDHTRQEKTTLVVGGSNPKTERTSANININPYSWLTGGWSASQSESIPETGISNRTTGINNTYTANYIPISLSRFKLSSRYTLSVRQQTAPSGTTPEVETDTNTFSQNYTISLIPHSAVPVSLGLVLENYSNANNHPVSTSQKDTQTENQIFTAGLTWSPEQKLSLSSTYNLKITKIIRDLSLSPQSRQKTILDSKATYRIFSWGTLVYNRQDENNGGEVQSGSVADLNIQKTTQTYSLNINIPVDNPVLSNFVFLASVKNVDYKNLYASSDDFNASLTTFEGSLNF